MKNFTIKYAGGRKIETRRTLNDAKASIVATWPQAFFYANDDRVLAWENEERSENDDGAAAVASIYEE
jgi:hypothetical protein